VFCTPARLVSHLDDEDAEDDDAEQVEDVRGAEQVIGVRVPTTSVARQPPAMHRGRHVT